MLLFCKTDFAPYITVSAPLSTNQNPSFCFVVTAFETPVKIDQPQLENEHLTRSQFTSSGEIFRLGFHEVSWPPRVFLFTIVVKTMIRRVCLLFCCAQFAFNNTFHLFSYLLFRIYICLYCFDCFVCGCVFWLFLCLFTFRLVVFLVCFSLFTLVCFVFVYSDGCFIILYVIFLLFFFVCVFLWCVFDIFWVLCVLP